MKWTSRVKDWWASEQAVLTARRRSAALYVCAFGLGMVAMATTDQRTPGDTFYATVAQVIPVLLLVVAIERRAFKLPEERAGWVFLVMQALAISLPTFAEYRCLLELAGDRDTESYRYVMGGLIASAFLLLAAALLPTFDARTSERDEGA